MRQLIQQLILTSTLTLKKRSSRYDNKNINKILKTTLFSIELVSSTTRVTSFKSQEEKLQKDKALIRPENDKRYCLPLGDLAKVIPCFTIYLAELHLNSRKNTEKGSLHDRMWPPVRDAVHLARVKGCKKRSRGAFGVRRWIYIYHRRHSAYLPPPVRKRFSGREKITSSTIRGFKRPWEYPSLRISFLRIPIHANVGWPASRWRNALWVHHCCLVGPSLCLAKVH